MKLVFTALSESGRITLCSMGYQGLWHISLVGLGKCARYLLLVAWKQLEMCSRSFIGWFYDN